NVIVGDQLDLAAVHAPRLVNPIEYRLHAGLDVDTPVGHRAGQVQSGPDDDFLVCDAHFCRPDGQRAAHQDEANEPCQRCADLKKPLPPRPPLRLAIALTSQIQATYIVVAQELLALTFESDLASFQDIAVIGNGQGLIGILLDKQDGGATRPDIVN